MPGAQTRPNLKIQEGCSNRCSFCVIPQTRGYSRSLSAHMRSCVMCSASSPPAATNWCSPESTWADGAAISDPNTANRALPGRTRSADFRPDRLPRLRLSSIEPMDWDADLIALMREFRQARLARHAHLPLQSGSDSVLRRMHRRYRPWHYAEKVAALLRAAGPALTLGADVMVGFPGETTANSTRHSTSSARSRSAICTSFRFHPAPARADGPSTPKSPVPAQVVNERMAALRDPRRRKDGGAPTPVHRRRIRCHHAAHAATRAQALGRTSALTENFLPVELDAAFPANQLMHRASQGITARNDSAGRNGSNRIPDPFSAPADFALSKTGSDSPEQALNHNRPVLYSGCVRPPEVPELRGARPPLEEYHRTR